MLLLLLFSLCASVGQWWCTALKGPTRMLSYISSAYHASALANKWNIITFSYGGGSQFSVTGALAPVAAYNSLFGMALIQLTLFEPHCSLKNRNPLKIHQDLRPVLRSWIFT